MTHKFVGPRRFYWCACQKVVQSVARNTELCECSPILLVCTPKSGPVGCSTNLFSDLSVNARRFDWCACQKVVQSVAV